MEIDYMREEYDIEKLNPRKNPYAKKLKKQITINNCAKQKKQLNMSWK